MPEFQAVQCFNCKAFVNQQKKKSKKWKCPICSSKQSVRRIFGSSSSSRDIRQLIVELNTNRAEYDQEEMNEKNETDPYLEHNNVDVLQQEKEPRTIRNKWNKFEQNSGNNATINDNNNIEESENDAYVLKIPETYNKNRRKARGKKRKSKEIDSYFTSSSNNEHHRNECDEEPPTKKIKINTNDTHATNTNNEKEDEQEWNWNIWKDKKETDTEQKANKQIFINKTDTNHIKQNKSNKSATDKDDDDDEYWSLDEFERNENNKVIDVEAIKCKNNGNIEIKVDITHMYNSENKKNVVSTSKWGHFL